MRIQSLPLLYPHSTRHSYSISYCRTMLLLVERQSYSYRTSWLEINPNNLMEFSARIVPETTTTTRLFLCDSIPRHNVTSIVTCCFIARRTKRQIGKGRTPYPRMELGVTIKHSQTRTITRSSNRILCKILFQDVYGRVHTYVTNMGIWLLCLFIPVSTSCIWTPLSRKVLRIGLKLCKNRSVIFKLFKSLNDKISRLWKLRCSSYHQERATLVCSTPTDPFLNTKPY